jgi:cytochrome c oxidase assembly protein subunit 11
MRDVVVAASCGAFVALMVGMAYAAVPLYDWFCRTTGFGGRTQVATSAPANVLDRKVTVRFDANVAPGLPWRMTPERPTIEARLGDVITVDYTVINEAARETAGTASYNVTPLAFGIYFQKINCFCFTEQRLKAGEKRTMTVVFYVDPALINDGDAQEQDTLTLSYTFHPQREPQRPVAESNRAGGPGRI